MTRIAPLALAFVFAAALAPGAVRADPEALWKLVHDQCAPNEAAHHAAAPCLAVDAAHADAVLKDRDGATQVLLIPTVRATGIESPVVLGPSGARWMADAWAARSYVEHLAGKPVARDDLSLAVNSIDGRSQNQLHIHVDCIRADVKAALAAALPAIGRRWTTLTLAGHPYRARRLGEAELARTNLFRLVAASAPDAAANMGLETLVVAGATFAGGAPGFVVLAGRADPEAGDYASGEELQDHACHVLQGA